MDNGAKPSDTADRFSHTTTSVTIAKHTFIGAIKPADGDKKAKDRVRVFHSIPYCALDNPFADASRMISYHNVDETQLSEHRTPKPDAIALTITTPQNAEFGDDLPVLVYIHGGSYIEGSHEAEETAGNLFARDGVITVTIGYRLGLDGFVRFADNEPHRYRGIDDCQFALEWVQHNIEYFGGDPTNVTLMGHSAGGGIVLWLCRKDHYRGAFRRAIALSPAFPRQHFSERKGALRRAMGKPVTRRHLLALRKKHPKRYSKGVERFYRKFRSDVPLGPSPFDATEIADIPVILSTTRDEMYGMDITSRIDTKGWGRLAVRLMAKHMQLRVPSGSYLAYVDSIDSGRPLSRLVGDSTIRRWVSEAAEAAPCKHWLLEMIGDSQSHKPALHCAELPLIFGTYPQDYAPLPSRIAQGPLHRMVSRFCQGEEPSWPEYVRPASRVGYSISLIDARHHLLDDPLKYVRISFSGPRQSVEGPPILRGGWR